MKENRASEKKREESVCNRGEKRVTDSSLLFLELFYATLEYLNHTSTP